MTPVIIGVLTGGLVQKNPWVLQVRGTPILSTARGGRRRPHPPTTSTRSAPSRSPGSPATRTSSASTAGGSAGTPRSWSTAPSDPGSASAATSRRTRRPRRSTRSGFNHFFRGPDHPGGGDQVFFQGHASPGMYARAFLEGRLTEDQLDGFRQEKSHIVDGRSRAAVLPAPAADAGLLGVPDGVDGPRPDERDLPGAVQQVPAPPRHQGHLAAARLGVPRRRRDGRAGVARPAPARRQRRAGQPDLRHQLQPAAPRRPGPRQRQDHPGARGVLPRRRLERHQGDLGPRVGPAARRRPRRRSSTS